jgi:hypothetical protein
MLEGVLGKEVVDKLLYGPFEEPEPQNRTLDFLLVLIRDSDTRKTAALIKQALQVMSQHECMIDTVSGSYIRCLYGGLVPEENGEERRAELVCRLKERFTDEIKIVHGRRESLFGNFGCDSRAAFTAIIPGYCDAIRELGNLEFGQVKEI